MKTIASLGIAILLILAGLVRIDLVAQEPRPGQATETSVHRGPNHVMFAIRTDLQRLLIGGRDDADTFLLLNGPALLDDGRVDEAGLRAILLHLGKHQPKDAKVYVRVFRPSNVREGKPLDDALGELARGSGIRIVKIDGEYRNDRITWQDRIAHVDDKANELPGEKEIHSGNETIQVYPVRTALSRFLTVDSDCVVDILRPAAPVDPDIAATITASVAKLNLRQKDRILFRVPQESVPPVDPDFRAHDQWFKDWDRLAKSLGFNQSSVSTK